ncbi:MAG: SDR family oxidoreductase [Filomicrobium sp.]
MAETRIALVTGGNRGIGLEIVKQLSRLGVMTALGSRDKEKGEAAAASLAAEGLEPVIVELDVTDPDSVKAAVDHVQHLFGRIDILINNAGVLLDRSDDGLAQGILAVTPERFRQTFEANTLGPFLTMQEVLPLMQEAGYGRIVNMSSGLGQLSEMGAGFTGYRVSKAALNALTVTVAADVGEANIKINTMCPGWVRTDMGGADAMRSVEEGAETAVWLATLPETGPTAGFFRDKKQIEW